ncbi:MAG: AbrB/MazE/SpoVT family DNA-binding domain-containing protein [Thermoplasmata archaeon]
MTSKVALNGRIYLGHEAMRLLGLKDGDFVQLVENQGLVFVAKVVPPS